jgi:hypothetical protein
MIRGVLWEWVPWIINRTSDILDFSKRIILAAYTEATVGKEWIFLNSVNIPLSSLAFPNIPLNQIRWRAQTNPPVFIGAYSTAVDTKHISYLGLSVILPGMDPIDLTEWINEVKWAGDIQPSPAELFTLWCCETGSPYFHLIPTATMELITADGSIISKELNYCAI